MPVVVTNAAASTLSAVIGQVRDALRATGNQVPVMIGAQYIGDFGAGKDRRVIFVPERRGKIGPPVEMGDAASMTHGCDVAVRAAENSDDLTRMDGACLLADLVIDYVGTATNGRVEWGDISDDSPLNVDSLGADLAFSFKYTRAIRHDAKRRALAPAPADTSLPFSPVSPQAQPGTEPTSFDLTTEPE